MSDEGESEVTDGESYTAARLAADLRRARAQSSGETEMLGRVRAIARQAAARKEGWLRPEMCRPDPDQGFGMYLLHEEDDHELAVFVVSWLPRRGTPPHDHGTWAVIAGIDGAETNSFWKRFDDGNRAGYAKLRKLLVRPFGAGDVLALPRGVIHSVYNASDRVTVSLHIYGRHVNHTERSRFDPERCIEAPYQVATVEHERVRSQFPSTALEMSDDITTW